MPSRPRLPDWMRTPWALPLAFGVAWALVLLAALVRGEVVAVGGRAVVEYVLNAYLLATSARVALMRTLDARLRTAWAALTLGNVVGITADVLWYATDGDSRLSEVLYLGEYPCWFVALWFLPRAAAQPGERLRVGFDLATVFVAAVVAVWDAIVRPVAAANADDFVTVLLAAGAPVGDLVLLAGVAALILRRPEPSGAAPLLSLAASLVIYAVLDLVYAAQMHAGAYVEGGFIDFGWFIAQLLIATAALQQARPSGDARTVARMAGLLERSAIVLPIFATALGFYLILRVVTAETLDRGTLTTGVGAILLCLLVLTRQTHTAIVTAHLNSRLQVETAKSERLLLNILPGSIAGQLKEGRRAEPLAESFAEATVLFADLVGFTPLSAGTSPQRLVLLLDEVFSRFDALAERHGLEKIKTIGDAYMAAAGVPIRRADHAQAAARMALGMRDELQRLAVELGVALQIRIGLHSGPVVAGVIGHRKFSYDLWGDTVNTASRMESHGLPGAVHVSGEVAARVRDAFVLEPRGTMDIKGKGPMETFLLVAER